MSTGRRGIWRYFKDLVTGQYGQELVGYLPDPEEPEAVMGVIERMERDQRTIEERNSMATTGGGWNNQNWGSTAPYNDGPGPYQAPYRADVFTTGEFEFGLTSSPGPAFEPRHVPQPPPAPVLPPAPPIIESADAGDRNIIVRGGIRSIE